MKLIFPITIWHNDLFTPSRYIDAWFPWFADGLSDQICRESDKRLAYAAMFLELCYPEQLFFQTRWRLPFIGNIKHAKKAMFVVKQVFQEPTCNLSMLLSITKKKKSQYILLIISRLKKWNTERQREGWSESLKKWAL